MNTQEIYAKLKEKLGENKVSEYVENDVGDSWITVSHDSVHEVALLLRDDEQLRFDACNCISGMDWKDKLGVVYHLHSHELNHRVVLHVDLERSENALDTTTQEVQSVSAVWPTADWHEREAYDMFGIRFVNHPDFRRILCPDDWEGWPLRKDYKTQEFYRGMPVPYPADEDLDDGGTYIFEDRFSKDTDG